MNFRKLNLAVLAVVGPWAAWIAASEPLWAMPEGPRCDRYAAQPPAAFSCQHRIAIAGEAR